ncbi:MAG: hypothetical protein U5K99_01935 [Anaerolineales bacterium]|nr:hypothetical protein [Anaerolineales bacterium]
MSFDWSPDGERLAIADGSSLYVLHLISGEKRTLFTIEEPNEINHVSWQP